MAFLGMRGTGDWATNQRPENWRETILFLYPNGKAPLTAITSMLPSEPTTDPKFHWWTKNLPEQIATITGVYTDSGLSSAYAGGGAKDAAVYVKMSLDDVKQFRPRHQVRFSKVGDYRYRVTGRVEAVVQNGANSYVLVYLNTADHASYGASGADRLEVCGNMNAEGAEIPVALGYDPVQYTNVTQIFRTSLSITRTARKTKLRTGDAYREMKRECLELHSIEIEKAILDSALYEGTGANGKPLRAMDGILEFINDNASDNIDAFNLNTDYSGASWLESGEDWIDEQMEQLFKFGTTEKLGLAGNAALRGVNRLAKAGAQIQIRVMDAAYGLKVVEWVTPFGTLFLKTHPLFSHNPTRTNDIVILEPANLKTRVIDDTKFKADDSENRNTNDSKDSTDEEFLTEIGMEYHHPATFGYLAGVGKDNTV